MRFQCEHCTFVGSPRRLWHAQERVALECPQCGRIEPIHLHLEASDAATAPPAQPGGSPPHPQPTADAPLTDAPKPSSPAAHARTDVDPEPTPRAPAAPHPSASQRVPALPEIAADVPPQQCRKCGHRQADPGSCHRCGFSPAVDKPGEMPWDRNENVDPADLAEAQRLWEAALAEGTLEGHRRFTAFCKLKQLDDLACRRYRFRVADRPDDGHAAAQLEDLFEAANLPLSQRFAAERAQLQEGLSTFRKSLYVLVILAAILMALFFFTNYPNILG